MVHLSYIRFYSSSSKLIQVCGQKYTRDSFTNVTPKILSLINTNLHLQPFHPLSFIRENIVNFFYENFRGRTGNPLFSVYDRQTPVVTTDQNFDSLLVPTDHVSRSKTDCYYINNSTMLRAHMTAYQGDFLKAGLNKFLMVGDVYRRDEIDRSHYPVFHQLDAVHLSTPEELFVEEDDGNMNLQIFESDPGKQIETPDKQSVYTLEASKRTEQQLKATLEMLTKTLFGDQIVYKWTDAYFPFTHPSWELEIMLEDEWLEVLGCGVMKYEILKESGCTNHIGWAFGVGLERLAMLSYKIPDIRLFWSKDSGFTHQFDNKTYKDKIIFKEFSQYPQCISDISFWLPNSEYCSNDFYELAREIGGNCIEQIKLVDEFSKNGKTSHCYRIVYRAVDKTLTQKEVNTIHSVIANKAAECLQVKIR